MDRYSNSLAINALLSPFRWQEKLNNPPVNFTYSFILSKERISYNEKIGMLKYIKCFLNEDRFPTFMFRDSCPQIEKIAIISRAHCLNDPCSQYLEHPALYKVLYYGNSLDMFVNNLYKTFINHPIGPLLEKIGYEFFDLLSEHLVLHYIDDCRDTRNNIVDNIINVAFQQYINVANISFLELKEKNADIVIKLDPINKDTPVGYAIPNIVENQIDFSVMILSQESEKWLKNFQSLVIHESGHLLGLKHPFDEAYNLPYIEENTGTTLMSYNVLVKTSNDLGPELKCDKINYTQGSYKFDMYYVISLTLGPYDIRAIQYLYGKNPIFRNEDNYYNFCEDCETDINISIGKELININLNLPQSFTIYDTGGVNTIDIQNCNYPSIVNIFPLPEFVFNNINIVCNSYFWIMSDIIRIVTSSAPISIEAARDISHEFNLYTTHGYIEIGSGPASQKFFIHSSEIGKIYINGVKPNDIFYFDKNLFSNTQEIFAKSFFNTPNITTVPATYNINFLDNKIDKIQDRFQELVYNYVMPTGGVGHVKICLNSNCSSELNLIYDEFSSLSFTGNNINFY